MKVIVSKGVVVIPKSTAEGVTTIRAKGGVVVYEDGLPPDEIEDLIRAVGGKVEDDT